MVDSLGEPGSGRGTIIIRKHERHDLEKMFCPETVAVIGASAQEGKVGHAVFRNLLTNGYTGVIYPVNPKARSIMGVRSYASVKEIQDNIDLAVIIIPARAVPGVLAECGQLGVRNAIVISAGFKEVGGEGIELENELKEISRKYNINLVGPNCLGIMNTDPKVRLNASFARVMPAAGQIGFVSQSGALACAVLDYAKAEGVGFSKCVSLGNKAVLNEDDFLCYLAQDSGTEVVALYVEDLSNGQEFIKIAREMTGEIRRPKPILAVKSGRSAQGAKAAASHTGSLAGSDAVYDAIFKQSGVLRVETVEDLLNYAVAFATQPLPRGKRVGIVTNAGGPGIIVTDSCVSHDLEIAQLSEATQRELRGVLPPAASVHNPVDVLGDAQHDRYEAALRIVLNDENVDGVIVILTPQYMTDIEEIATVIVRVKRETPKPILATFMGLYDTTKGEDILERGGVPHYPFPEGAVCTMAAMGEYARWLYRPRTTERVFVVDAPAAKAVIDKVRAAKRTALPEVEAVQVLAAYGFPVPVWKLARNEDEVRAACQELGFPLVLKIASPQILHKVDVGGVKLNIRSADQAVEEFKAMVERAKKVHPDAEIWGANVQKMAPPGKECILGAKLDPQFGHLIMFGLGGIYTEVFRDVSFRLAPLRELGALRMIQSVRAYRLLEGFRGEPPADIKTIADCLQRLSQLLVEIPQISELDINPLIVHEQGKGATVADARIILTESPR